MKKIPLIVFSIVVFFSLVTQTSGSAVAENNEQSCREIFIAQGMPENFSCVTSKGARFSLISRTNGKEVWLDEKRSLYVSAPLSLISSCASEAIVSCNHCGSQDACGNRTDIHWSLPDYYDNMRDLFEDGIEEVLSNFVKHPQFGYISRNFFLTSSQGSTRGPWFQGHLAYKHDSGGLISLECGYTLYGRTPVPVEAFCVGNKL